MTKRYTAADFANARFAEHPSGARAMRTAPRDEDGPWYYQIPDCQSWMEYTDHIGMAETGWVPVPTKPTITESEYRLALDETRHPQYVAGFTDAMRLFGGEVIPGPEPTDEELLAGIIRNIDDWQSITSPELLAKYLNTAGVTPPKENN